MAHVVADLPSSKANPAAYATYYKALVDDYDPVYAGTPADEAFRQAEKDAMLALVPRSSATKVFGVDSGNWNTAGNWSPSGVPGAGAIVVIGEGCTCTYDKNDSSTAIDTLRVDGNLYTDPDANTALLVETMVITPTGFFRDGTRAARVSNSVIHDWIINVAGGDIDIVYDTFFQSRGILSMGRVDVWGAYKTPFLEVASYAAPVAAATSLALASAPTNWNVNDEIIICSTRAKPESFFTWTIKSQPPETERKTLTSSSGVNLGWTGGLTYSHIGPQGTLGRTDCKAYVAMLTRNVRFRPSSASVAIHHRGHMMQMHNAANGGWSMRDAEVADLGRTSKAAGRAHFLVQSQGALTAGVATDLTLSPHWNGSAISFGPTFKLFFSFTASGAGNVTITGTKADGSGESETLAYVSGANDSLYSVKYFLTVTSITYSTTFASNNPQVFLLARSRQLNELGVRDLHTGTAAYTAVTPVDNIQGRYPFHWHKLGATGDILENPPVLIGCTIHGSPGWLVAQHQTHAHVMNCVGYNAQGAGLVGEDGPESGLWQSNLMATFIGNSDATIKANQDLVERDPAATGAAFWFTGRSIKSNRNVAIDAVGAFAYNARLTTVNSVVSQLDQPSSTRGITPTSVHANIVPLAHFDDNVCIACYVGFSVVKGSPIQRHDLRTILRRFKAWSVHQASDITYTRNYTLIDWNLLYGRVSNTGGIGEGKGIALFTNTSDQVFVRPIIEGFGDAIDLHHNHSANTGGPAFDTDARNGRKIVDHVVIDCDNEYVGFNATIDEEFTAGDLNSDPISLVSYTASSTEISGTKHDEFGDQAYRWGYDEFTYTRTELLTANGYYTDTASGNKYTMMDEWFSSALTGEPQKTIVPIDVTSGVSLSGMTNHGSMDLTNNTPPTFANFTVSTATNTNDEVDIVGRATGNSVRFGGFQRPMKTYLIDNGDGTITIVPLVDEAYTETCYVWVDDVNGNTSRAVMTIIVGQEVTPYKASYSMQLGF